ncbi:MAG: hypothetical protein IK020_12725 [Clostridiales bacterium]|nr:hypothetical protein [Clostridiales bacterium]
MKKNKKLDARYYDLSKVTAKEIAEDLVAAREEAEEQALLDDGWIDMGTFDADDDEAWAVIRDKMVDMME